MPASYATAGYHGLHAFRWVAADGSARFVRYHLSPVAGEGVAISYTGNQPIGTLGIAVYVTKSGVTYRGVTASYSNAVGLTASRFGVQALIGGSDLGYKIG